MESRGDGSSHVDKRPSQKKVVASVYVQYLELHTELCGAHLKGQINCPQCVSLNPIKSSHVDLVLLMFPKVKPQLPQCRQWADIQTRSIIYSDAVDNLVAACDSDVQRLIV